MDFSLLRVVGRLVCVPLLCFLFGVSASEVLVPVWTSLLHAGRFVCQPWPGACPKKPWRQETSWSEVIRGSARRTTSVREDTTPARPLAG